MSEKIIEAGFDHPCRETCSGWQQGFERGVLEGRAGVIPKSIRTPMSWELLCQRVEELESILSQFNVNELKKREARETNLQTRLERASELLLEIHQEGLTNKLRGEVEMFLWRDE